MRAKPSAELRAAKALIATPEQWVQFTNATDADGRHVEPSEPSASCFCMNGALMKVVGYGQALGRTYLYLTAAIGDRMLSNWQDVHNREHREVLKAFDRAIATAESEGQ